MAPRTPTTAPVDTSRRSWSTDSAGPCPDCAAASSPAPLPLVREAPFFDEILGQLQAHHQLPDFRARQSQLALLRLGLGPQPALALLDEDAVPLLELVGRHLVLPRHGLQALPAHQPEHQLRLALHAPTLGQLLRAPARPGFTALRLRLVGRTFHPDLLG